MRAEIGSTCCFLLESQSLRQTTTADTCLLYSHDTAQTEFMTMTCRLCNDCLLLFCVHMLFPNPYYQSLTWFDLSVEQKQPQCLSGLSFGLSSRPVAGTNYYTGPPAAKYQQVFVRVSCRLKTCSDALPSTYLLILLGALCRMSFP